MIDADHGASATRAPWRTRAERSAPRARRIGGIALVAMLAALARPVSAQQSSSSQTSDVVPITNRAILEYRLPNGTINADSATARIFALHEVVLGVTKRVDRALAERGDTLTYTIEASNTGNASSAPATLLDTLPAGLALLAQAVRLDSTFLIAGTADASALVVTRTPDGRDVVQVQLGALATGQHRTVELRALVRANAPAGSLANTATLTGGPAVTTAAPAGTLVRAVVPASDALRLRKSAGVLDVSVGEAVPYAVTLVNRGDAPLADIVLTDALPRGMRLASAGMRGADSTRIDGQRVTIFVAGPIAARDSLVLRYGAALVAPPSDGVLTNEVWGSALAGAVQSDTARATVRLRRDFPLRDRTLVGKVWLDRNANGVQEPGEEGVPFARVLGADGTVLTADREGRLSFAALEPGTHVFRLDTLGLPPTMQLADPAEVMQRIRTDGWTTARLAFRVIPREVPVDCDTVPAARDTTLLRTASLRSADERAAELRRNLVQGPGVQFTHPTDGLVLASNRLYVGVRGEPGAPVQLYDGERLLRESQLRPDGSEDFVALEITPGPHTLRVRMRNSWQQERWDSLHVHGSGAPVRVVLASDSAASPALRVDAAAPTALRFAVLDQWGVPVTTMPTATVEVRGAQLESADVDASSVGHQLRVAPDGTLLVPLRAGTETGQGALTLRVGSATLQQPLAVLPSLRPFTLTGAGQAGVGAAPLTFGVVAGRGTIGRDAALSVTYDSRRVGRREDYFARGVDPLGDATMPTLGDSSTTRFAAPATGALALRLERGLDWLAFGDVDTRGFSHADRLMGYSRLLEGVSGRLQAGHATWHAFGSATPQALTQRQVRGDGTSGPFAIGQGVRPGTELVTVEIRAADNAARLLARQSLARGADYDVDYAQGLLLLHRAAPATDTYGNPVFVVITFEQTDGGPLRAVGGVRAEYDLSHRLALGDSASFGAAAIRDEGALLTPSLTGGTGTTGIAGLTGTLDLASADVRVRRGGLGLSAEALRGALGDSSAVAARAALSLGGDGARARADLAWLTVRGGLPTPVNPRIATPLDELRGALRLRAAEQTTIELREEYQRFPLYGASRMQHALAFTERVGGRAWSQQLGLLTTSQGARAAIDSTAPAASATSSTALTAKLGAELTSRLGATVDGSHTLAHAAGTTPLPDAVGIGLTYRLWRALSLEGSHRQAWLPGDSVRYNTSSIGVRTGTILGAQLRGSLERTDAASTTHALSLGWMQNVALNSAWSFRSMFERRVGLSRAPLTDPVRALPFPQLEQNRWSLSLGTAWKPAGDRGRFTADMELHDGDARTGWRLAAGADAPLGANAALLARSDWVSDTYASGAGERLVSHVDRSVLGVAFRPASFDALNALAKLEWRRTRNPFGVTNLGVQGESERLIAILEGVWAPDGATEIAARYGLRWTAPSAATAESPAVSTRAHFAGTRAERQVWRTVRARIDGRLLVETTSASVTWGLTPSLVWRVGSLLAIEGGYRAGPLTDSDFTAVGTPGLFVTFGVQVTESAVLHPVAFWRNRLVAER